jgi:dTDP-4-amino-4,6-dideoxygalactose transaminase
MSIKIPFQKVMIPASLNRIVSAQIEAEEFAASETLESRVTKTTGAAHALATSSSTAALHLAMCALDLKRGDKVLCSINSFVDVPEVVRHFDAEPVFVDTLPGSYALDPEKLREAAETIQGKKLRAVIVSHPAGHRAPMEAIREVADAYDLQVIEDATERIGAEDIGQLSDMAVIGLGSKVDNTIDGGLLLTDDAHYYERGKLLRNHGMVYTSEETRYLYDVLEIGCQYRMQEFSALYCQALFDETEEYLSRRRTIAEAYFEALKSVKNITLPTREPGHVYTQFIVEIGTNRDAFARKLKETGIEVGLQSIPLNFTQYYKDKYKLKVFDFPVALSSYQKMMSLPIYPQMSDADVQYVCETMRTIAASHR